MTDAYGEEAERTKRREHKEVEMAMERPGRKNARAIVSRAGYRIGGHLRFANGGAADDEEDKGFVRKGVGQHEGAMHKGEPKTKLRLQTGGNAYGMTVPQRGDRAARGRSNVNIFVSGGGQPQVQAPGAAPIPMPPGAPPMPPGAPPMPPPGAPPGAGPMPPGGLRPPMGMPGGMPGMPGGPAPGPMAMGAGMPMGVPGALPRPPGMARGGRARTEDPKERRARGGRSEEREECQVGGTIGSLGSGIHKMSAGAGTGQGRLQKIGRSVPRYQRST
jgi:hypothetical protein